MDPRKSNPNQRRRAKIARAAATVVTGMIVTLAATPATRAATEPASLSDRVATVRARLAEREVDQNRSASHGNAGHLASLLGGGTEVTWWNWLNLWSNAWVNLWTNIWTNLWWNMS
jgi:hypothetical protein